MGKKKNPIPEPLQIKRWKEMLDGLASSNDDWLNTQIKNLRIEDNMSALEIGEKVHRLLAEYYLNAGIPK